MFYKSLSITWFTYFFLIYKIILCKIYQSSSINIKSIYLCQPIKSAISYTSYNWVSVKVSTTIHLKETMEFYHATTVIKEMNIILI